MEVLFLGGRRRARHENPEGHWAPKWRRLLVAAGKATKSGGIAGGDSEAPLDYTEFDRTVRGMLNRISTENARRLLPLEPGLRGAGGDCPPWWAARFAALMLASYLQVIHTNRGARGLAMRSADNVLPEYLDAVSPLLAQCPRLVESLLAWLARLLQCQQLCWPTVRLLLLAAREERDRAALPAYSLGRLPPELVKGRILSYLAPPLLPVEAASAKTCSLSGGWSVEDGQKDVIAVLAHLIMFGPPTTWPRLSAFAFSVAESALTEQKELEEGHIYLAASILVTIAQRLERKIPDAAADTARSLVAAEAHDLLTHHKQLAALLQDLGPLGRLAVRLADAAASCPEGLSGFVQSRVKTALEHVRRVQERLVTAELRVCPTGVDRVHCWGRQRRCP
mmetsp:Transcript_20378/g.47678  ORF Transcript_20378/g.47678 Transcript_20378/m.47678 type:complete len:394 (-) Transcript_20378:137-1318(-)